MFIILQQTWFSFHCEITLHRCHLLQLVTNQIVIIISLIIIAVIREIIQGRNWPNFCVKAVLSCYETLQVNQSKILKDFLFSVLLLKIIKGAVSLSWLLKYPKLGMSVLYKGTDFSGAIPSQMGLFPRGRHSFPEDASWHSNAFLSC